jgi:hypothetical protein
LARGKVGDQAVGVYLHELHDGQPRLSPVHGIWLDAPDAAAIVPIGHSPDPAIVSSRLLLSAQRKARASTD